MSVHPTEEVPVLQLCGKDDCQLSFASANELKKHQRLVHQTHVTCALYGSVQTLVAIPRGPDGTFACPTENCTETSNDPVRIQRHVKNCDPAALAVKRDMIAPPDSKCTLVPIQDQVIGMSLLSVACKLEANQRVVAYCPVIPEYSKWLGYNRYAEILICLKCHTGVPPNEVESHMAHTHKEKIVEADIRRDYLTHGILLPDTSPKYPPRTSHLEACDPVQGLLMYLGYLCTVKTNGNICGYTTYKEKTIHADGKWSKNCQRNYVQHLTKPVISYFCVNYRPPSPSIVEGHQAKEVIQGQDDRPTYWIKFGKVLAKMKQGVQGEGEAEPHPSLISIYLQISGVYQHIQLCKKLFPTPSVNLYNLIHFEDEAARWLPHVTAWMSSRMEGLKDLHYGLRKEATMESTDKEAPTVGLSPLQEKRTRDRYSQTVTALLVFTWKASGTPLASFWSKKQSQLAITMEALARCLNDTTPPPANLTQNLLDQAMFHFISFSCSLAKRSRIQSALEQFIALSMLKEHGTFHQPREMTHNIAAVQYAIRLGTMFSWITNIESEEELEDPNDPTNDAELSLMKAHFSWISSQSRASPFQTLRDWMRLATSVIMNQQLPNSTRWADSEMTKLVVGTSTITIIGIQTALRATMTALSTQFQMILNGATLPDFLPSKFKDHLANNALHYNYLSTSSNNQLFEYELLHDWVNSAEEGSRGILADNWQEVLNQPEFNLNEFFSPPSAWRWLENVDTLLEMIYFIYHVGCGQPARGTEETCMLLRNSNSAPRSVYWRTDRIMLQTWYHKGQNVSHRSKPRQVYLTGELSMQLHNYLAYIRPVQILILRALDQHEVARDMEDFLWMSSRRGRLETEDFTRILKKHFSRGGCDALGIRSWRQASVSITAAHLSKRLPTQVLADTLSNREDLEEEMGLHNVMDLQRNHTSHTANLLYGFSSGSGVVRDAETNFMRASEVWQSFWGIESHLAFNEPLLPVPASLAPPEKARQALTIFTHDPDARFRTSFQHKWLTNLFEDDLHDFLVVAPTGAGKSLAFCLPPLVFRDERLILVQPLKALVSQTLKDLEKLDGVRYQLYRENDMIDPHAQIIVALSDDAASVDFHNQLRSNLPTRIIIDECHTFLEDTYRNYLPGVVALGQLCSQLVLMTASLPPKKENHLISNIFRRRTMITHRASTFRPELQIEIHRNPVIPQDLPNLCSLLISTYLQKQEDRAMIFIENRDLVTSIAGSLNLPYHHSGLNDSEREQNSQLWLQNNKGTIVATSGFGAGINYPHVRLVVIYGIPNQSEANKAYQQIGRAGRDGQPARIEIVAKTTDIWQPNHTVMDEFKKLLMNPSRCPAQVFSQYEDVDVRSCHNYPQHHSCSVCTKLSINLGETTPYESEERPTLSVPSGSDDNQSSETPTPVAIQVPGRPKRTRSPEVPLTRANMQVMEPQNIRKVARIAEERRVQGQSAPSSSKTIANTLDSTHAQGEAAKVESQYQILADFIVKAKGTCPECYCRRGDFIKHFSGERCREKHGKCLRCRLDQNGPDGHGVKSCPALSLSSSVGAGTRGRSFQVCYRCALPSGKQDCFGFHPENKVMNQCDSNFDGIAKAVGWYLYREEPAVLGSIFPGIEDLSAKEYSIWMGVTDATHGPAPWPNIIKLVVAFIENRSRET
ncbi:hypothetical protein PGTUg99_000439 [Puccinia graminis f. sp. tritici]|uniref:DNA 3'-5' helicase n=2 Tax=Puccinia graminis f. sp. tritici TaxID=56615 RepID=A0A5B0RGR9_PUCGR|nr:hypothetical protein PGTUg99_000439 [Puccinia graminis f. sp. tritici]